MVQEQNPEEHHTMWVGPLKKQLAIFTLWYLSIKYDENQLSVVPDMPYHIDKCLISQLYQNQQINQAR